MEIKKFILSLFFFLIFTTHSFASQIINKIVAVVGDEFLTLYDLDEMCKPYFERFIKPDLPLEGKRKNKKIK